MRMKGSSCLELYCCDCMTNSKYQDGQESPWKHISGHPRGSIFRVLTEEARATVNAGDNLPLAEILGWKQGERIELQHPRLCTTWVHVPGSHSPLPPHPVRMDCTRPRPPVMMDCTQPRPQSWWTVLLKFEGKKSLLSIGWFCQLFSHSYRQSN